MEPIKFFNLQKNNKKSDNQPDYRISFKTKDTFIEGGACWIKKDKSGNTFLSCKLSDLYTDQSGVKASREGWHIAQDASQTPKNDHTSEEIGDIGF